LIWDKTEEKSLGCGGQGTEECGREVVCVGRRHALEGSVKTSDLRNDLVFDIIR
jgi:hypothetical protein